MTLNIEPSPATDLPWIKSSYSGTNGNCIEAAALPTGARAIRDSKQADGPMLIVSANQWSAFTAGIASGSITQS